MRMPILYNVTVAEPQNVGEALDLLQAANKNSTW